MSTSTLDDIPVRPPSPRPPNRRRLVALLVAGAVLAVAVGSGLALTRADRPGGDAGAPTQPTTAVAVQPAPGASPDGQAPARGSTPTGDRAPSEAAAAVATAREFLARELGMTELVALPFRSIDARTGEVGFRHKYGEGRRLLPQTGPYAVVVRLQRLPAGWWVLGVQGRSIQITSPVRLQRISSPLTVRGKAEVYEGSLYFKVTQDRPGRDLLLGEGLVDGSASSQPGDLGRLRFRQPASAASGWVILYDAAADGSNGIIQATMVRVRFEVPTPAPRVLAVTTSPTLRDVGGWRELPKGPGTVRFTVRTSNTDRVRFVLTPTGTGMGPYARLLGEDHDARDGFTLTWSYGASDAGSAHLTVQATGPGGTVDHFINITHAA
jgi:hypothetical protein